MKQFTVVLVWLTLLWQVYLSFLATGTGGFFTLSLALVGMFGMLIPVKLSAGRYSRILYLVTGFFFVAKAVLFPYESSISTWRVVPSGFIYGLAEWFFSCQVLVLLLWKRGNPFPNLFAAFALVSSLLFLDHRMSIGETPQYVLICTVSVLLPVATAISVQNVGLSKTLSQSPIGKQSLLLGLVAMVMLGTWTLSDTWSGTVPGIQSWFIQTVGASVEPSKAARIYVNSGRLTAIRSELLRDPNRTALRVYADERPGYLAGRIFDRYEDNSWSHPVGFDWRRRAFESDELSVLKPSNSLPESVDVGTESMNSFELSTLPRNGRLRAMRVQNDPRRGRVYFTPAGTRFVQGKGEQLAVDDQQIIRSGLAVDSDYIAYEDTRARFPMLTANQRKRLLQIPDSLDDEFERICDEVVGGQATFEGQVNSVREHLQSNFEYSLEPRSVPPGVDPVLHFLRVQHPAHCEFFASAAALMLRRQGIPTRYVTGFRVMSLEEENEDYWIARNRNAHAWAEAFDERTGRWIIVEATPGFEYQDGAEADGAASRTARSGQRGTAESESRLGRFFRWIGTVISEQKFLAASLFGGSLFGFAIYLGFQRWRLGHRNMRKLVVANQRALRAKLKRCDRQARRLGFPRGANESPLLCSQRLSLWLNEMENADQRELLRRLSDGYRRYCDERFGPNM